MKKALAILAALALGAIAVLLIVVNKIIGRRIQGVVVTQHVLNSLERSDYNRTVIIAGNKQKVDFRGQTVVVDLDAGELITLDNAAKTYTRSALSAQNPMVWVMPNLSSAMTAFKKAGAVRTVSGYKCQEYTSTAISGGVAVSTTGCFSAQVPGAADYAAFTEHLARKFVEAGMAKPDGSRPEGIPIELAQTIVRVLGPAVNQSEQKVTTISIKTSQLPTRIFRIPAGYTKMAAAPVGAAAAPRLALRLPGPPR